MKPNLRVIGAVGALVIAGVVSGCGGGSNTTSSSPSSAASTSPAAEKAAIKQNWTRFFDGSTPASEKVKLLQSGTQFAPVIDAQAKSPLAKSTKVTVSNVTLNGSNKATVTYTIDLNGKPALKNQKGTAVHENGTWKVGNRSFCQLLALQGKPPAGCPTA
jgi:hypothetical protein